jgi:hypothetical protein
MVQLKWVLRPAGQLNPLMGCLKASLQLSGV